MVIDESHMTLPQVRGMFAGDQSRKKTLVDYGFRLPSAMDNRPLNFDETQNLIKQTIFTSATPAVFELEHSGQIVRQEIRPTGVLDPVVEVRPVRGQVDDLLGEINKRTEQGQRVLVTTLTKRMAEDLSDYLLEMGVKVHYLHSEVHTIERTEILRDLALAEEGAVYTTVAELPKPEMSKMIIELEKQMKEAAQALEFEKAAVLRDQVMEMRRMLALKDAGADSDLSEWERMRLLDEAGIAYEAD